VFNQQEGHDDNDEIKYAKKPSDGVTEKLTYCMVHGKFHDEQNADRQHHNHDHRHASFRSGGIHFALDALPGLKVYPSQANFLLVKTAPGRADSIHRGLVEAGILIKNLSPSGGLLQDCLRITVGTPEENARLLEALATLL